MTSQEFQSELAQKKAFQELPLEDKKLLSQKVYNLIGVIQSVHNDLGPGLPEYIYQEALTIALTEAGFMVHKEMQVHPIFRGKELTSYIKMDLVAELPDGNVIIECKALTSMGEREHYQLFGYLRATRFPIGILANFGTHPKATIERYHFLNGLIYAF